MKRRHPMVSGMMTSFGEGFYMTPMELTGIVSGRGERWNSLLSSAYPGSQTEIDPVLFPR